MRILYALLFVLPLGFASCKKENNAPSQGAIPIIDSNFLKFTSSEPLNGTVSYVAPMQGLTQVAKDSPSTFLLLYAQTADSMPGQTYQASLVFETAKATSVSQAVSITIPWGQENQLGTVTESATLGLTAPNGEVWNATGGTAHIVKLGGGLLQGYFNATLTNEQQPGKSIMLTNGTFNVKY